MNRNLRQSRYRYCFLILSTVQGITALILLGCSPVFLGALALSIPERPMHFYNVAQPGWNLLAQLSLIGLLLFIPLYGIALMKSVRWYRDKHYDKAVVPMQVLALFLTLCVYAYSWYIRH